MKSRYVSLAWLAQNWGEDVDEPPLVIGGRIIGWAAYGSMHKDAPSSVLGEAFLLTDGTPVSPGELQVALGSVRHEQFPGTNPFKDADFLNGVIVRTESLGRFCHESKIVPPRCVFGRLASAVGHLRNRLAIPPEPPMVVTPEVEAISGIGPTARNELFTDDGWQGSHRKVVAFLEDFADGSKPEKECRAAAEKHFGCKLPEKNIWRKAWNSLPPEKKRSRGKPTR